MQPGQSTDDERGEHLATVHERRRKARSRRRRRRGLIGLGLIALAAGAMILIVSRGGDSNGSHGGASGRAKPQLRWLLGDGPPESVRAENAHPGSNGWRLPSTKGGTGTVSGYFSSQDVMPGDLERLYIKAPQARTVQVRIFRIGWYGGRGGRLVAASGPLRARRQPPCTQDSNTGLSECSWKPSLRFRLPRALVSGVYVARIDSNRGVSREALMIVGARSRTPLLVQIPTSTYEAYNAFGGHSVYPGGTPIGATTAAQGVEVSFDRPYDSPTGVGEFFDRDVAMVRFLERNGYPLAYTTPTAIQGAPGTLAGRRMILDSGHSEYWSDQMLHAFRKARDRGTNLGFFSSDTAGWRIEFSPATRASSEAGAPNHRFVAWKEHAAQDPKHRPATFPDSGASLTGSAYTDCIAPRIRGTATPTYRYYDWHPQPRGAPSWLYRGTGFRAGSHVPGILGYELDHTTPDAPRGIRVVGGGTLPCMNPAAPRRGDTTLYRARSGAYVFTTGTLGWMFGLIPTPGASPDAPRKPNPGLVRMTENILRFMLAPRPV